MTNERLIKSAHIWGIALLLLVAIIVGARPMAIDAQNSNQNSSQSNGNSNSNQSTKNSNSNSRSMKNDNASSIGGQTSMSSADRKFMMDAAMGGMMEVELGRMAAQQGSSEAVKQLGQRMVDDHSKANAELMTIAQSKGVMLPMELDQKHRAEADKLMKMSGAEFDRAYAKMMLSDHNKDVAMFERQSMRGMDPDLKAFAGKTLPTLREHLQMVKTLNGSGSANSNGNSNGTSNGNSNRP